MTPSDRIPPISDFSPGIVRQSLRSALEILAEGADRAERLEKIKATFFNARAASGQEQSARNVLITLPHLGLADSNGELSDFGRQLLSMSDEDAHREFARHCLVELRGLDILRAIRDLNAQGVPINKVSLQHSLETAFGMRLSRNTTDHTTLTNWMRLGGVLKPGSGYEIDEAVVRDLAGVTVTDLEAWQALPLPQRAFLTSLRIIAESDAKATVDVKRVKNHAETHHGSLYADANSRRQILEPLEKGGWIALAQGTTGRQGGKGGSVTALEKLLKIDVEAVSSYPAPAIPFDLREKLGTSLVDLRKDLKSSQTYVAGIALELLALKMSIALGLSPIELRKRDDKTGGGEVDLLAEGVHLHFSRWLFQCKNQTAPVSLGALAKEIGMAVLLQAHVIVIATTGRFSRAVEDHARMVAASTAMQVVLIDGGNVNAYLVGGEHSLREHFHATAGRTLAIKSVQRRAGDEPGTAHEA